MIRPDSSAIFVSIAWTTGSGALEVGAADVAALWKLNDMLLVCIMKDVGEEGSKIEGVGLVYEALLLCRVREIKA